MFGDNTLFQPHEWLLKFRNPFGPSGQILWETSFFTNELEFYFLAIMTYIHAKRHGSRYVWLWWTTVAHGLMTECVSYWAEPIDNFWHAQSTFMFFGQREPLHIMCLYPGYIYTASVAVERLNLSELTQACTVALFVLMFDIPYDIMGVKMLWWTWHDTDANIRDRHYWVPWTSYYFHMTFAFAFNFIYNKARRHFVGISDVYSSEKLETMSFAESRILSQKTSGEWKALILTGLFSMPFGICQFVPGYHLFKDVFNVSGQVTTGILGGLYLCVAIYGILHKGSRRMRQEGEIEIQRGDKNRGKGKWHYDEIMFCVMVHFLHYVILVTFSAPENKQVLGLHQPMGSKFGSGDEFDCGQMRNLSYPYPFTPAAFPPFLRSDLWEVTVWKRPYICENGYLLDEAYMDFHCEKARQQEWIPGNQWFWVCGTPFSNPKDPAGLTHVEYALVVYAFCLIGFVSYTTALCYPRNIYTQFISIGEFPKYYLTDYTEQTENEDSDYQIRDSKGKIRENKEIVSRRINAKTGEIEYKIGSSGDVWKTREELNADGVGEVYGNAKERFGMFGRFYDAYRNGSTRDRMKMFEQLNNANERIQFFTKSQISSKSFVGYNSGVPNSLFSLKDLQAISSEEKSEEEDNLHGNESKNGEVYAGTESARKKYDLRRRKQ